MAYKFNPFTGNLDEVGAGSGGEVGLNLGSEGSPSLFFNGDENTGLFSPGADKVAISTNGTGRLFVDAAGRVGIGSVSASDLFEVSKASDGSVGPVLSLRNSTDLGGANSGAEIRFNFRDTASNRYCVIGAANGSSSSRSGYIYFKTNSGTDAPVERLRVTSDGKVGIGTTSPGYLLDVRRYSAGDVVAFTGSTDGGRPLKFVSADNGIFLGAQWTRDIGSGSGIHAWAIDGSERVRIDSSGRLGVGTSSPSATLEVVGSARFFGGSGTDGQLTIGSTGASNDAVIIKYDNANDRLQFYNWGASTSNQNTFVIDNANSRVGIGTTGPVGKLSVETPSATDPNTVVTAGWDSTYVLIGDSDNTNGANLGLGFRTGGITSGFGTQIVSLDPNSDWYPINYHGNLHVWYGGGTERVRIDSSGRLGVGTSFPDDALDVRSGASGFSQFVHASGQGGVRISGTGAGSSANLVFSNNHAGGVSDEFTIQMDGATDDLLFISGGTGGSERVRIDSSGNVGIGTSSPATKLHISDTSAPEFRIVDTTNNCTGFMRPVDSTVRFGTGSSHPLAFLVNSSEVMRIDTSGRLLVGASSSSDPKAKLKVHGSVNIGPGSGNTVTLANGATGTVATPVRGYSYVNISHSNTTSDGLLLLVFANTAALTIISTVHSNAGTRYTASVSGRDLQVTNALGSGSVDFYASCMTLAWGSDG